MDFDIEDIDIVSLRSDLIDYFGTAMFNASPLAIMDLSEVENASAEKLIRIAINNHFDIEDYRRTYRR